MRYFVEVSYQGQAYHGWQVQLNANSVQQEINKALSLYCRHQIETVGSGRTDAGVHAKQQYCHADIPIPLNIPEAVHKINAILPADISVNNIFPVASDAHARFDAILRSYEYHISRKKDPFNKDVRYYFRQDLSMVEMNVACTLLVGEKDFRSFSKVKTSVDNYTCKISQAYWETYNDSYCFYVSANRFLRGMVRALVGTLLEVGTGKMTVKQFEAIIKARDRRKAGRSVPAQGLYLKKVEYPAQLLNTEQWKRKK